MKRSGIIILVVVGLLVLWAISVRNGLATAQTGINGKWGEVETQFQRKKNMYDNVVATIKGAARNEDTTLIKIVQMRSKIPNVTAESLLNNLQTLINSTTKLVGLHLTLILKHIQHYRQPACTEICRHR